MSLHWAAVGRRSARLSEAGAGPDGTVDRVPAPTRLETSDITGMGARAVVPKTPKTSGHPRRGGRGAYPRWVIFQGVGDSRPYPDHGYTQRQWGEIAPSQVRLDQLVTTKRMLDLDALLAEDSTFYGDLFAHVVRWRGTLYLEDGLHRALRAALQQRTVLHARVLELSG